MTATFHNPRWDALPAERMRGCSFADNFLTQERSEQNFATVNGTGTTFDHGVTFDGNGYLTYEVISQPDDYSVVLQFRTTTADQDGKLLLRNGPDPGYVAPSGFCIGFGEVGLVPSIYAIFSDGTFAQEMFVPLDYFDGELHTVTLSVNKSGGTVALFVDDLDPETTTHSQTGTTGATTAITAGFECVATLVNARVFNAALAQNEHDVYHAGTLKTFHWAPYACWRCDEFCDDAIGNKIWDRTTSRRDLTKADGSTSAKFPTLVTSPTPHYVFDGIDDYVSNLPALPAAYTISAAIQVLYPYIEQHNDQTFTDLITAEGAYNGNLHSMIVYDSVLSLIQRYHDEYQQLYWLWRGRAFGMIHRLITEGTGKFALFLDYVHDSFRDFAQDVLGTPTLVTGGGTGGAKFESATSNVQFPHAVALQVEHLTIAVHGVFDTSAAAGTIVDKGTDYKLLTNGNQIDLNGSTISHTFDNNEMIGVSLRSGEKPRFYVDGIYIGEGSSTVNPDDTDTTVLNIGNNNEKNSPTPYAIKQVYICDEPLT